MGINNGDIDICWVIPKIEQSIPDNTKMIFSLMGFSMDEWELDEDDDFYGCDDSDVEGKTVTVLNLATYTELGDKDYEYYDIEFEDGRQMYGVSGYNLTYPDAKT